MQILSDHRGQASDILVASLRCEEEENLLILPEIEPRFLGCPAHSLIAIPSTMLAAKRQIFQQLTEKKQRICNRQLNDLVPVSIHTHVPVYIVHISQSHIFVPFDTLP
jgi:hypothetical protein